MSRWIKEPVRKDGFTEPGIVKCGCGEEVMITHDACECECCGQLFNLFGQRLAPRDTWGDNYYRNFE